MAQQPENCWSAWVETRGLEPLTPALQRQCSARLSYVPGSAHQATAPSSAAPANTYRRQVGVDNRRHGRQLSMPQHMDVSVARPADEAPPLTGKGSRGGAEGLRGGRG